MTLERALEICIELWTWLANNPTKQKAHWPGWSKIGFCSHDCPICQWAFLENSGEQHYCNHCPMKWLPKYNPGERLYACEDPDSPYYDWAMKGGLHNRTLSALRIVREAQRVLREVRNEMPRVPVHDE